MRAKSSQLRRQLLDLAERAQDQLQGLIQERGPLVRGSLGVRYRRCGKAGCRCTKGRGHKTGYLSATDSGKSRQVHVPVGEMTWVGEGVTRYRRFARGRRRLAQLFRFQLLLAEDLKRSLLTPYPTDKPFPPACRRGRQSEGGGNRH